MWNGVSPLPLNFLPSLLLLGEKTERRRVIEIGDKKTETFELWESSWLFSDLSNSELPPEASLLFCRPDSITVKNTQCKEGWVDITMTWENTLVKNYIIIIDILRIDINIKPWSKLIFYTNTLVETSTGLSLFCEWRATLRQTAMHIPISSGDEANLHSARKLSTWRSQANTARMCKLCTVKTQESAESSCFETTVQTTLPLRLLERAI